MNKKIITKEALVLLGFILLGIIIVLPCNFQLRRIQAQADQVASGVDFSKLPDQAPAQASSADPFAQPVQSVSAGSGDIFDQVAAQDSTQKLKILRNIGFILIFAGYPAYLLVRFFIWAVKSGMLVRIKQIIKTAVSAPARIKQTAVLWIMGILICGIFLGAPKKYAEYYRNGAVGYYDNQVQAPSAMPVLRWDIILPGCLTVLIIGGLLIYTLREKK